jgi:hypothetical protein
MDGADKSNLKVIRDARGMHKCDWWRLEVIRVISAT